MNFERRKLVWVTTACAGLAVALVIGCDQQAAAPQDTRAADAQAIKDLDVQWSKTAAAHDVDGTVAYYSDDAMVLPPNEPVATTKPAIRAGWAGMLMPGVDVTWQASTVEVAKAGDIAYEVGTYAVAMRDAKGNPGADHGKIVVVWKKQADGKWKAAVDTWNSDLPAVAPEPAAAKKK
jgi:ketosteroid isomerase-like protein